MCAQSYKFSSSTIEYTCFVDLIVCNKNHSFDYCDSSF